MFRDPATLHRMLRQNSLLNLIETIISNHARSSSTTGWNPAELPEKLKKSKRKPMVTSVNELKRKARIEKAFRQQVRENILKPPENGMLVSGLVSVAHELYAARTELLKCVSKVAESISIYSCRMSRAKRTRASSSFSTIPTQDMSDRSLRYEYVFGTPTDFARLCGDVHVGHPPHTIRTCNAMGSPASKEHDWKIGGMKHVMPVVESFHLFDRIGRAVSHNERLQVDRVPAIVELCIQAGVDVPEYPTRRRKFPVYSIAGRILDFERRFPKEDLSGKDVNPSGFWEKRNKLNKDERSTALQDIDLKGYAVRGMEAWEKVRLGAPKLMRKYGVQTCGYCPEVQVGPKGHRVRNCQAYKLQMRDGQHAWQEATPDDLLPPVFVWHVGGGEVLQNNLKRYYGMLPAVVELFAQAGARVGEKYIGMMREDVAVPDLTEEKWVV